MERKGMSKFLITIYIFIQLFNCNKEGESSSNESSSDKIYIDNKDGTVTDSKTKLVWQKCSIGQENDNLCSGKATKHNWEDSIGQCVKLNLAGRRWSLPSKKYLESLIIKKEERPRINTLFFPNTRSMYYWSSDLYPHLPKHAWIVSFNTGSNDPADITDTDYVRCVSEP
jgi:hypothetical protein